VDVRVGVESLKVTLAIACSPVFAVLAALVVEAL
jgi:hypothetical protein